MYSILARLRVMLLAVFDPHYRNGRNWWRALARSERPQFEARQCERLRGLVQQFLSNQTLSSPSYEVGTTIAGHADLQKLPILQREGILAFLPRLQKQYEGRTDLVVKSTSGSTAAPVRYLREASLSRVAEGMYNEMYRLSGWRPGIYRVGLWGNYNEFGLKSAPNRRSKLLHKWVIATYAPTAEDFLRFSEEVLANKGCAVFGYASVVAEGCRVLSERGVSFPAGHVLTCFTGAETLLPTMRRQIEETLHCRVHDGYSSREAEHIALECLHGTRHVNPRYIIEAVSFENDEPCAPAEVGRLLITDLFNRITPHLRYEIGDAGSVGWSECSCGLAGQTIPELQGRLADIIRLPNGRNVTSLYFYGLLQELNDIDEFQLVRLGDTSFELRYRGRQLPHSEAEHVVGLVRRLLGDVKFVMVQVEELPRTPGGKWRFYSDERSAPATPITSPG